MGYEHLWIDVHGDDDQWRAPQFRCRGNEYHPERRVGLSHEHVRRPA